MADWRERCQGKLLSAQEAVAGIKSGDKVVFGIGGTPFCFDPVNDALVERRDELTGVIMAANFWQPAPWLAPGMEDSFPVTEAFVSRYSRDLVWQRRADYLPHCFSLGHPHRLMEPARTPAFMKADWAVVAVSAPNQHGDFSFGHGVWFNKVLIETANRAIGVVCPRLPWTYGDTVHISQLDYVVEGAPPPAEMPVILPPVPQDEARAAEVIAALTSELVRDGDTIQIGIGTASMLVPSFLNTKSDLGIHTEMFTLEMVLDLVRPGVATGKKKSIDPGKAVASAILLMPADPRYWECLEFIDHNPAFEYRDLSYICNHPVLASLDNMVAINNAMAVDLMGQVVVESAGLNPVGGLGGHVDFTIASHYSRGGRAITLVLSTAQGGKVSRIVPQFPAGAHVGLPAAFVDYLVTEHGVVNLEGKTRRQRAEAIISIAHPDFQPELRKAAREMFY